MWRLIDDDQSQDSKTADSELPLLSRLSGQPQQSTPSQEDDVDVDKLPRATANKKRKGKMPLDDQQLLWRKKKKNSSLKIFVFFSNKKHTYI